MSDSPLTNAVIILCVALMGWYAVGSWWNRRRAMSILKMIRAGLGDLGARANFRWGAISGLDVPIMEPRPPFARVRVHLTMEAREILILWLVNHYLRGRRDQFIIDADLTRRPDTELLVADPATALGKLAIERAETRGQVLRPAPGRPGVELLRWGRTRPAEKLASEFARGGSPDGMPVWVAAVQMKSPQLLVICGMETVSTDTVKQLLRRVRELAKDVSKDDRSERAGKGSRSAGSPAPSKNGRTTAEPAVDEDMGISAP